MHQRWMAALAIGVLALVPTIGRAQAHPPEPEDGPHPVRDQIFNLVFTRHARLGIKVNLQARTSDSIGAYVDAVTPSGPAAKAGLKSGDIITKLDGKSLLESPDGPATHDQSLPGVRLIEIAARLQPDDTVPVEYRRGTDRRTAAIVTDGDRNMVMRGLDGRRGFAFRMGDGPDFMGPGVDVRGMHPPGFAMFFGGELADLELAPMNAGLGQYFGTSEGVLVISAPSDSALGLKAGDVVFAVDGRKPSGPSHLLRILRSYDRGENFKLDIMRNHKRQTLTSHLGEAREDADH
ncbi:MAG TPA: PDZ domain-containing protein [Gemmatimonadales bacterium]|nr:PDZ domain-containing protein [Gemmatimonadales bacterium]